MIDRDDLLIAGGGLMLLAILATLVYALTIGSALFAWLTIAAPSAVLALGAFVWAWKVKR